MQALALVRSRPLRWAACIAAGVVWCSTVGAQSVYAIYDTPPQTGFNYAFPIGDRDGDLVPDIGLVSSGRWVYRISSVTLQPTDPVIDSPFPPIGGANAAPIGDFDGDGVIDYLRFTLVHSGADGSLVAFIRDNPGGEDDYGTLGVGVGDVNDDGYDDFLLSGRFGPAAVYGGPDGRRLYVVPNFEFFGFPHAAAVGDVDDDGCDDFVIGHEAVSTILMISGRTGATLYERHSTPDLGYPSRLGSAVRGIGDYDGDGRPDFVAGAEGTRFTPFLRHGSIHVFSGPDGCELMRIEERARGFDDDLERLGTEIDSVGDVNGDGVVDIAVQGFNDYSSIYSLRTGALLWRVEELEFPGFVTRSSTVLFDIDGDGDDEWAVGDGAFVSSPNLSGRLMIFHGSPGDVDPLCEGQPNSTGGPAVLKWEGSIEVDDGQGDQRLYVTGGPPFAPVQVFYGAPSTPVPVGAGTVCIDSPVVRYASVAAFDAAGAVEVAIDWSLVPDAGPTAILPGTSWGFQAVYRDHFAGDVLNWTSAVQVLFVE